MRVRKAVAVVGVVCAGAAALAGCGSSSSPSGAGAPTVSLWTATPQSQYRAVNDGARLALADAGGRAGAFRINYSAREISDDPAEAVPQALDTARSTLQDTQSSAMLTSMGPDATRQAITLLNEAGIGTVSLGDEALRTQVCSAASRFYPNGHATAIVVDPAAKLPAAWSARFESTYKVPASVEAYRAYLGVQAVLHGLATPGVASKDSPPRLNRNALAAALVRSAQGGCA